MRKHIFLSITERCNLNCVYCFEKSKRKDVMSFEKAIEIIEREMYDEETDDLDIDFMGGEPFLEFDLIKRICEYVWSRKWPIKYRFTAATNGTLVHGTIKDWLRAHNTQFLCFLSIDGIKEAHDINRTNSFDRIDVKFFRDVWPNRKAKMLCSKESLRYLAESVKYLHSLGFPEIELKLAYSFDWRDEEKMKLLIEQYKILCDYYVEHIEYKPVSLLNMDMAELNYAGKTIKKWCTCGIETCSYEMDGTKFPCRYYQDLVRYNKVNLEEMWNVDYYNIQETLKGKCRQCLLRDLCRTCYAYNMDSYGDYGIKNDYSCHMTKISAYYSAKIILGRYEKSKEKVTDMKVVHRVKYLIEAYKTNNWKCMNHE